VLHTDSLRVSPFTYFVEAILGVAVAGAPAQCSSTELVRIIAPTGTCADFLGPYQSFAGGTIINPQSTGECQFCSIATTDVFLQQVGISFANRWRDIGIIVVYIAVNTLAAFLFYWLARVVSVRNGLIGMKLTYAAKEERQRIKRRE
jgi:ATP-binding cassette subfamily G (WHITE) protein 2 (PDR)